MEYANSVKLPVDYFARSVKLEYSNWKSGVAREFFQNSVDADSTRIAFDCCGDTLRVTDNGCGMTRDVIENKLLKLLETTKGKEDTGGFGKAKELLYFAWPRWSIRTQNLLVEGKYINYNVSQVSDSIPGTVSEVTYGESVEGGLADEFQKYVGQCSFDAEVKWNGARVNGLGALSGLTKIKDAEMGDLCKYSLYELPVRGQDVLVRCGGLYMFSRPFRKDKGLIFEVPKGLSRNAFTSNRDGFTSFWSDSFQMAIILEGLKDGKGERFMGLGDREEKERDPLYKVLFDWEEKFIGDWVWEAPDPENFMYGDDFCGFLPVFLGSGNKLVLGKDPDYCGGEFPISFSESAVFDNPDVLDELKGRPRLVGRLEDYVSLGIKRLEEGVAILGTEMAEGKIIITGFES